MANFRYKTMPSTCAVLLNRRQMAEHEVGGGGGEGGGSTLAMPTNEEIYMYSKL